MADSQVRMNPISPHHTEPINKNTYESEFAFNQYMLSVDSNPVLKHLKLGNFDPFDYALEIEYMRAVNVLRAWEEQEGLEMTPSIAMLQNDAIELAISSVGRDATGMRMSKSQFAETRQTIDSHEIYGQEQEKQGGFQMPNLPRPKEKYFGQMKNKEGFR